MEENEHRVDVTVSGLTARYGVTGVRALLKVIAASTMTVVSSIPDESDPQPAKKLTKKQRAKAARPTDWKPRGGRVAKDKYMEQVVEWFRSNGINPAHACAKALRLDRKAICKTAHRAVELGFLIQAGTTRPAQGGMEILTFRAVTEADLKRKAAKAAAKSATSTKNTKCPEPATPAASDPSD